MYIRPCKKKKAHCLTVQITFSYTALHITSEVEHNGIRLLKFLQLLQIAKGWVDCASRGDKCRGEKGEFLVPPSWIVHHSLARNCYIESICWQVIQKWKGPCRSSTWYTKIWEGEKILRFDGSTAVLKLFIFSTLIDWKGDFKVLAWGCKRGR